MSIGAAHVHVPYNKQSLVKAYSMSHY